MLLVRTLSFVTDPGGKKAKQGKWTEVPTLCLLFSTQFELI